MRKTRPKERKSLMNDSSQKKRRGRPRKEKTLSEAERQRNSRARKRQKEIAAFESKTALIGVHPVDLQKGLDVANGRIRELTKANRELNQRLRERNVEAEGYRKHVCSLEDQVKRVSQVMRGLKAGEVSRLREELREAINWLIEDNGLIED